MKEMLLLSGSLGPLLDMPLMSLVCFVAQWLELHISSIVQIGFVLRLKLMARQYKW